MDNNTFANNFVGIKVEGAPEAGKEVEITSNTMDNPIVGIQCYDNPGATITIGQEGEGNTIAVAPYDFGSGIYLGIGAIVQEINPYATSLASIAHNTITNCVQGIATSNMLDLSIIDRNAISMHDYTVGSGIHTSNAIWSIIQGNDVDAINHNANQYGIRVSFGALGLAGVQYHAECRNRYTGRRPHCGLTAGKEHYGRQHYWFSDELKYTLRFWYPSTGMGQRLER